jgi:rare lipoprotein A (peptidoglycan hydrolase)
MRILPLLLLSLLLSGCAGLGALMTASAGPPPAPLAATVIDDQAINFALESFDAALTMVDAAMDAGKIKPGTPQAKAIAAKIRQVQHFLAVADAAQKAGQAATYADAFRQARTALSEFRAAIPS